MSFERRIRARELAQQERDLEQRDREYHQREAQHAQTISETRKSRRLSLISILLSIVVSTAAIIGTLFYTQRQIQQSTQEFQAQSRADAYRQVIDGLGSPTAAVRTNSMRLLTDFVQNPNNYETAEDHTRGVIGAIQLLGEIMEANSTVPGRAGLSSYGSPIPLSQARAASRLRVLVEDKDLGQYTADMSRTDLHGIALGDFQPAGMLVAIGTDFRRGLLSGLDLRAEPALLSGAYFTCSNLRGARFGAANVTYADFTGADLTGADLSDVSGLEAGQLHGAIVENAKLPANVRLPGRAWKDRETRCSRLVNNMTGMRYGQGYRDLLPCPTTLGAARKIDFNSPFAGDLNDLVAACRLRNS